jgi:hypothetical protein
MERREVVAVDEERRGKAAEATPEEPGAVGLEEVAPVVGLAVPEVEVEPLWEETEASEEERTSISKGGRKVRTGRRGNVLGERSEPDLRARGRARVLVDGVDVLEERRSDDGLDEGSATEVSLHRANRTRARIGGIASAIRSEGKAGSES